MKAAGDWNPVPKWQVTFDRQILVKCWVFVAVGAPTMGAVLLPNAQVHEWLQLSPALPLPLPRDRGHAVLHRPAAVIASVGARRGVRQHALMAGKPKGKGVLWVFFVYLGFFFGGGGGLVTVF